MADYQIFETAAFLEDLANIPASQRGQLRAKLEGYIYPLLRRAPREHPQARALRGYQSPVWRWRLGDWRAVYHIDDAGRTVSMVAFKLRRDAY